MTPLRERFVADIDVGAASTPERQDWALRSAVALGVAKVRFSGGDHAPETLRLAESLRVPVVASGDDAPPPLVVPAAAPSPAFLRRRLPPGECNLASPAMEDAFAAWAGPEAPDAVALLANALHSYRMPAGFDAALRLLQIAQAASAERAATALRAEGRAATIRVAAPGAGVPFASLDPDGGWRPLHYRLREALAPAALSATPMDESASLLVRAANRRREPLRATLLWRVARLDGLLLDEGRAPADLAPESASELAVIPLSGLLRQYPPNHVVVWLALEGGDGAAPLARACATLCPPKRLALQDPAISVECESVPARSAKGSPEWRRGFRLLFPGDHDERETQRDGGHWFRVTLTALCPTLWAWLETPGLDGVHFGENFLHLESDTPVEILVRSERPLTLRTFRKAVAVRSLFDTFVEG